MVVVIFIDEGNKLDQTCCIEYTAPFCRGEEENQVRIR